MTRHGPARASTSGDAVDGVALRDPAEIEAGAGPELDRPPGDENAAAAGRGGARGARRVQPDVAERAVVAGGHDRVVDGGVEPAAGALSCRNREGDDVDEVGSGVLDPSLAVELRQLRVVPEAREQLLEALELPLGPVERQFGSIAGLGVEEELHIRSHRSEGSALHHEVRVIVSGGRFTTRTAGAAAVCATGSGRACADAICALRAFSAIL